MKLALFDMDGTLSDDRHRRPLYVPGQYSDYWKRENMLADPVFPEATQLMSDLREQGWSIGILCARVESHNIGVTKEWLSNNDINYDYMWLKPDSSKGATPPDFKQTIMDSLIMQYKHMFTKVVLFDNDPAVVLRINQKFGSEHIVHCTWENVLDPA